MIRGIGTLIRPQVLKSLNSIEKIKPRAMVATLNDKSSATIISCYSPPDFSEETDLIPFYNEFVRSVPKHNVLVIVGNMNAQIGKNVNHKFSLLNSSNRNREHLTDFTLGSRLTCLNTKFEKRKRKPWTFTYTNNTKLQKVYVLINKKWNNSALNGVVFSSFEGVSSYHQIVTAKIRLSLRRNATRSTNTIH